MDEATYRLREMYGLNLGPMPFALQFPRLPPGILHPASRMHGMPKAEFAAKTGRIVPNLQDFGETYQRFASGLVDASSSVPIPPGHPLYSRQGSAEMLRAENSKLKKENMDLRKQLQTPNEKPKHNP